MIRSSKSVFSGLSAAEYMVQLHQALRDGLVAPANSTDLRVTDTSFSYNGLTVMVQVPEANTSVGGEVRVLEDFLIGKGTYLRVRAGKHSYAETTTKLPTASVVKAIQRLLEERVAEALTNHRRMQDTTDVYRQLAYTDLDVFRALPNAASVRGVVVDGAGKVRIGLSDYLQFDLKDFERAAKLVTELMQLAGFSAERDLEQYFLRKLPTEDPAFLHVVAAEQAHAAAQRQADDVMDVMGKLRAEILERRNG